MSDPSLLLQTGIVAALKATGGVGTDVRVYDTVPSSPVFPYVVIGDDQLIGDDTECGQITEVTSRIHVWSRATGFPECKTIAGAIRDRLRSAPPTLSGFTIDEVLFVQTQYLRDPDGLSRHAVIEIQFLIQHS